MEHVTAIDYLFVGIILVAGFLSLRALTANLRFLIEEIRIPRVLIAKQMPSRQRALILMIFWIVLTAMFSGTATVLFLNPTRFIAGRYSPDMYGWMAGLVMLVAAIACAMLVFRYYLLWSRFNR